MKITFAVNGARRTVDTDPLRRLADVLRRDLDLPGTKVGCGEGECGACTVLVDGRPANSCLIPVGQVSGREVTTIEGVAESAAFRELADRLVQAGATQCGICTPGLALSAAWFVDNTPSTDRAVIRQFMAGNMCRCTGYQLIVDAIAEVAHQRLSGGV